MSGTSPETEAGAAFAAPDQGGSPEPQPAQKAWVVDQAAWDEQVWRENQVWVVDQEAGWTFEYEWEDGYYLIHGGWIGDGEKYYDDDEFSARFKELSFLYVENGRTDLWYTVGGGRYNQTTVWQDERGHWEDQGHAETVHHDEVGHAETVHHDEVGHAETVHHDEVGHWE